MTRKKTEVNCPYCGNVYAASGMTAHVRHKHPEVYEEFKANRAEIVDKNTIAEGAPAPKQAVAPEPTPPLVTEPNPPVEPTPKTPEPANKQQSAGFLGGIAAALRSW